MKELRTLLQAASHALRSYQHGNTAPDLAEQTANQIDLGLEESSEPNVFERACRDLPEGWVVTIYLENGAASLVVENPEGFGREVDPCDRTIEQQIDDVVAEAATSGN